MVGSDRRRLGPLTEGRRWHVLLRIPQMRVCKFRFVSKLRNLVVSLLDRRLHTALALRFFVNPCWWRVFDFFAQTRARLLRSEAGSGSCSGREPRGVLGTKRRAPRLLLGDTWTY